MKINKTSFYTKQRKPLKRTSFSRKRAVGHKSHKKRSQRQIEGNKRKKKTSLRLLKDKLWSECKRIMRIRHPHVCYTCGKQLKNGTSDFHTGHFIPSSICSTELRYDLNNLRPQCSACNIWKSGNWVAYERHLIADGIDVEALKQRNEATKNKMYREDWYTAKITEYKAII